MFRSCSNARAATHSNPFDDVVEQNCPPAESTVQVDLPPEVTMARLIKAVGFSSCVLMLFVVAFTDVVACQGNGEFAHTAAKCLIPTDPASACQGIPQAPGVKALQPVKCLTANDPNCSPPAGAVQGAVLLVAITAWIDYLDNMGLQHCVCVSGGSCPSGVGSGCPSGGTYYYCQQGPANGGCQGGSAFDSSACTQQCTVG